jgi:hypothetical protein
MRLAAPTATGRTGRRSSLDLYADTVRALGAGHPLARVQHAVTVATRQAATASALLAASPCIGLVSRGLAVATAAAATLVTVILCGAVAALGVRRRARVQDVILRGGASTAELVRDETARLLAPVHRARVAGRLARALYEGEHWEEYLPASRPPEGVRHLRPNAHVIHEIVSGLDGDTASARAVILLERFLQGGYGAAIYQSGGPDSVRRELGRIRFELGRRV